MRGKGAAKLKWVTRSVGTLGASGACKKHLIPYYTATRTPLRGTPFLGPRPQILSVIPFFAVFLKKLLNQINHISYDELLELDKVNTSKNIRVHNDNKILNISLN